MSDTPTSRPLRKDAARNRDLLVQAAREVFAERGLEASLDDIARHAGLGVGTAYRHFANKFELADAIFAEAVERILTLAETAAAAPDPWDGIVLFLEGVATLQTADRGLREVLMGSYDPTHAERVSDQLRVPLQRLVERARDAGVLRPDIDSTDIGFVVIMLCTVADIAGDVAPELWRRYLPILLAGLKSDVELPVASLDDDSFRVALQSHKQRLVRAVQGPRADAKPFPVPKSG